MKFATKSLDITHLTLGILLHYLEKIKIQIICRYSEDARRCKKLHLCTDFNSSTRVTAYAECILCVNRMYEILSIRSRRYLLFTVRSAAEWPPVICACVPKLFQQLINTTLCPAFFRTFVCQPVCCVPLQIQTFIKILSSSLNTRLIVDRRCSDVCCDEFSVPQRDRKS